MGRGDEGVSTRLENIEADECFRLLGTREIGRVGISVSAIPEVLPVNYRLQEGNIVFRTGAGTTLHAATAGTAIAFEVDESDPVTLSGWSVLVGGLSEEVTDPQEDKQALAVLPNGWVPREHEHVIRLVPSRVSGRRIIRDA